MHTTENNIRWPMYEHVERRACRLNDMVAHLDVDPAKLARRRGGEAYFEARSNCLHCSSAHDCLSWLGAAGPDSAPPEFCPNLELLLSCKRDPN